MKYPGAFLEFMDYEQNEIDCTIYDTYNINIKYQGTAFATVTCNVDTPNIITNVSFSSSAPDGFNELARTIRRRLMRDEYAKFLQDTVDFYQYFETTLRRDDIEERLGLEWACYSPKTIFSLKVLYGTSAMKQRAFGRWINEQSAVKFVWDKIYGGFVPKALRRRYWNDDFNQYKYEYVWIRIQKIQPYIERLQLRQTRPSTPSNHDLLPYNARATSHFTFMSDPKEKTTQYYGLELEYENYRATQMPNLQRLVGNYCILKRDGSLSQGVEICSAPATFKIHEKNMVEFFKELPQLGLITGNNTGFHVHASREPLSFLQLGKIFSFINNADNEDLLNNIAGRPANHYCLRTGVSNMKSYPFRNGYGPDRYRRLNLTNPDTIEFRMFSTPNTYDEFMHKMEFCKSLIDYSTPGEVSLHTAEVGDNYLEYVYKNRHTYTHLWKHLLTSGV